ncbi:hypothetical protein EN938_26930 [Mesorhizobium sp. M7A.F.Ca.US.001.02.1.1]|nr:hypothetical protein EN938_26930 [Mesorhizobium sp. M7A.F.Ca.US.001.02.1.1]
MAEAQDKGSQELSYRLLGNAHEDVLTAFEATLKTVYLHKVAQSGQPGKPPKNDFQNVDFGRTRFAEFGFDPFAELRPKELSVLVLNIQKRHVIGHNLGVVDSKFAQHATDARLGETVKLVGVDIRAFAEISQRVVDRLDDWVADIVRPASNNGTLGVAVENDPSVPDETTLDNVPGDLGNLARKLGRWIAEQSKDGMLDHVDEDAVLSAFEGEPDGELEIAIAELEADGYVSDRATMNSRLPHFAPTLDLFVTFDPVVSENNPLEDAVGLIERIFKSGDSVDVRELHQSTGWSARRFNPAVSLVITEIDEGRVSQESANDYPARHFAIAAEDRVALRRFAKRIRG